MSKAQSKNSSYLCHLVTCMSVLVVVISMTAEQPSADMNALLADMNALLADMNALLADMNALLEGQQTHTSTSVK